MGREAVAILLLLTAQLCSISSANPFESVLQEVASVPSNEVANTSANALSLDHLMDVDGGGRNLLRVRASKGRKSRSSRSRSRSKHRFSNTKRANTKRGVVKTSTSEKRVYSGKELEEKKMEMQKRDQELREAREERIALAEQKIKDADRAEEGGGDKSGPKYGNFAKSEGLEIEDDDALPFRVTDFPSGSSLQFFVKGTVCIYEEFDPIQYDEDGENVEDNEFSMRGAWFVPTGGKVSIIVIGPSKGLLYRSEVMTSEGYWDTELATAGNYRICITSGTNQKLVLAMDIGSFQDRAESMLGSASSQSIEDVLGDDSENDDSVTTAVERLGDALRDVESEQNNLRLRLQRNHQTTKSNDNRMFYAGVIEGLVVIAMGVFQVAFMKSLFAEKERRFSGEGPNMRMGV